MSACGDSAHPDGRRAEAPAPSRRPSEKGLGGAAINPHNRFAPTVSEAWDDGWFREVPPCRATEVRREQVKSVITRNRSPDVGFDRSVNPYHGCEHGWIWSVCKRFHIKNQ